VVLARAKEIKECVVSKRPIRPILTKRGGVLNEPAVKELVAMFLNTKNWTKHVTHTAQTSGVEIDSDRVANEEAIKQFRKLINIDFEKKK
jgi:hypothetical protein